MSTLRDRVIPHLRPLEPLLTDHDVTDVMVTEGGRKVFIEKYGRVELVPGLTISEQPLIVGVQNIARALGENWSPAEPILDAPFDGGSRVAAVRPPVAVDGAAVSIRLFGRRYSLAQLVGVGMLSDDLAEAIRTVLVQDQRTVLIAGGTGTGKTTLLNALADLIPAEDRILLLEDTSEIHLQRQNLVRLTTVRGRPSVLGGPAVREVTMTELLRQSLRHRPDRIIVGEVRGAEAFDLLQALNTGHQGSLSTLHANSAKAALSRFAFCVQMAGVDVPYDTVCSQIAATGCVVVYIARVAGGRRQVVEWLTVEDYDQREGWITTEALLEDTINA